MANSEHQSDRVMHPASWASLALVAAIVLGALWLRSGLIGSDQWPIRWLDVEGELVRTSASQIRAAAAQPAAAGYFAVDLARVRENIEELPWVARAEVSRHWPDALHLTVVEHRPMARWNEQRLFSDRGDVFEVTGSEGMQGLARLSGPDSRREEVLARWRQMRAELAAVGVDIARLELDRRGAWSLTLDNGVELVLGREQIDQRLARYIAVHDELRNGEKRPRRIDMRYTNGLAVQWHSETQEEREQHG